MRKIILLFVLTLFVKFSYAQDYQTRDEIIENEKELGFAYESTFEVIEVFKVMLFNNPVKKEQRMIWVFYDRIESQREPRFVDGEIKRTGAYSKNPKYLVRDVSKALTNRTVKKVVVDRENNGVSMEYSDGYVGTTTAKVDYEDDGLKLTAKYKDTDGIHYKTMILYIK